MDLDINNYNESDLLKLLDIEIDEDTTIDDIKETCDMYIDNYEQQANDELYNFFMEVKTKVLTYVENIFVRDGSLEALIAQDDGLVVQDEELDEEDIEQEEEEVFDEDEQAELINDNKGTIERNQIDTKDAQRKNDASVIQGVLNPNLKNTIQRIINIDSQYRQSPLESPSTDFIVDLSEPLVDVISLRLFSFQLPFTWYVFSHDYGTDIFWINDNPYVIEEGNYVAEELVTELNSIMSENNIELLFTYKSRSNKIIMTNNTTDVLKVDFFREDYARDLCIKSNIKKNNNLGYLSGFRKESYTLEAGIEQKSEAAAETYGTKYVMIHMDDYNQNHINSGIIHVTDRQNTRLELPSYYDNDIPRLANCEIGQQEPRRFTQNQLYSINERIKNNKNIKNNELGAPSTPDILGIIPIKRGGFAVGDLFIEFGGSLQTNERTYFGPVAISRIHIKLLDDKGNVINLNDCNWSFSLICQALYQY